MPHLSVDPVVVSAHIITALQTIVSRNVSPLDTLVVSICSMQTSQLGTFNVIPDDVRLIGTVRTFRPQTQELAERRIAEIASRRRLWTGGHCANALQARPSRDREQRTGSQFRRQVGERVFGAATLCATPIRPPAARTSPICCRHGPGAYVWLGQGGGPSGCQLHNPGYDFNDEVIPLGAGYLASLVEEALPLR